MQLGLCHNLWIHLRQGAASRPCIPRSLLIGSMLSLKTRLANRPGHQVHQQLPKDLATGSPSLLNYRPVSSLLHHESLHAGPYPPRPGRGVILETAPSARCPQSSTGWMDSRRSLSTNHQRSIHYLSHAFPLHRNHQQRNPTRPPQRR